VAILLLLVGTLNIIYGIGAVSDANFYVNDTRYIFTNLHAMGWFLIIVGLIQLTGGFSLLSGNPYGRVIGVAAGTLGAIDALLSMGEHHPFWNLAIFALCVWVVYGIIVYGSDEPVEVR
jgi:tetrahydromethanopterin S-methyltransferase subunit C